MHSDYIAIDRCIRKYTIQTELSNPDKYGRNFNSQTCKRYKKINPSR